MTVSPLAAVRQVVREMYPSARVSMRGPAVRVRITAVPEADVVDEIRDALPAADIVVKKDRVMAHGGRCHVLEVRPVEWPAEPAVDGGPRDCFGGAA